jgi:hypothetical protein
LSKIIGGPLVPFRCWIAIAAGLFTPAAQAQMVCAPHADVVNHLLTEYGERRVFGGLNREGNLFELYVSGAGTWTVALTVPGGLTCLINSGVHGALIEVERGRKA